MSDLVGNPEAWFSCVSAHGLVIVSCFSDEIRSKMKSKYLSNPDFNFEKVNRASVACGPMVKWAIAQVRKCFWFINMFALSQNLGAVLVKLMFTDYNICIL